MEVLLFNFLSHGAQRDGCMRCTALAFCVGPYAVITTC